MADRPDERHEGRRALEPRERRRRLPQLRPAERVHQRAGGGRVSRFDLSTGARYPIITKLTAPFFLTCLDAAETLLSVAERDPANAEFYGCSYDAVIRVYDDAGKVIELGRARGDFEEW